jgi:hypothetical protein
MTKKSFAFLALIPLLVVGFPSVSSALTPPVCTITGTEKSDRLNGTPGKDIICGLGGNDIINSLGGDDVVYGGAGNDRIFGGTGEDDIFGDAGLDFIDGGSGRDDISGGTGNDVITGGSDADLIDGDAGTDNISGGIGDDAINGGAGKDSIRSGAGNDSCSKDSSDVHFDSCKLDIVAPEIGMQTTVVKTFQAGSTIKLNWSVSDSSGVEKTWGSIGGPPGWVTWCGFGIPGTLISGDRKNGVYQIECKLPERAVNETYSLFVGAVDVLGNSTTNMPQITFTIEGGSEDKAAPAVSKIDMDASSKPGEEFTVVTGVTDETGVNVVYGWFMKDGGGFASWTDGSSYVRALGRAELVNGDSKSGVYKQVHRFSSSAPAGTYTLWLSLLDDLGNRSFESTGKKITIGN